MTAERELTVSARRFLAVTEKHNRLIGASVTGSDKEHVDRVSGTAEFEDDITILERPRACGVFWCSGT
jgi:hypothetical protein